MDVHEVSKAVFAELERLGLSIYDHPMGMGMAGTEEGMAGFIAHLRSLHPGATWRDVDPSMPAHWVPGRPETWTHPYRPYGDWDFQAPPAGTAFIVFWTERGAGARHKALIERARAVGFPIHGGELASERRSRDVDDTGFVVFELGTSKDVLEEFYRWLLEQPGVESGYPNRHEGDAYAP